MNITKCIHYVYYYLPLCITKYTILGSVLAKSLKKSVKEFVFYFSKVIECRPRNLTKTKFLNRYILRILLKF